MGASGCMGQGAMGHGATVGSSTATVGTPTNPDTWPDS